MLGHSYSIGGRVIRGRQIGTKMGMPTVNIEYSESGIPLPEGVYASEIEIGGKTYRSISNFGANPTVCDNGQLRLETHILADVGELYGEYARVSLLTFMRREHKFENIDALRSQIEKDVKARYEMDI
jgi:riboflavin kinase/FMN adenylyltransferase